ncbi:MAG: hypothetical protein GXX10_05765 [Clostridiaceae bacterium]|nr:hypothetical protein [Clostridiaceae bacterium]
MKEKLAKLIDVKSIVTLTMTGILAALLLGKFDPPKEILSLFSTAYGAVITYFFTKKPSNENTPP